MSETVAPNLTLSLQNPQGANFRLESIPEEIEYRPVGFVSEDNAISKGMFYRLRGTRPKVGVHLMHPRTDQTQNYNILPLAAAGYAVLGRASRWPNNDVATIHEALLLDVAAGIRFLHQQGCEKVILLGNSGGSSLAAFYQSQATAPAGGRLTHTPAGDPFDLNAYDLPPADGIVLVAGHVGQGLLLGKLIDPSVVDENDPLAADPAFVDLSIEPDDRVVFSYFSTRPDLENFGEVGFARYVTPRAWLSTWSALSSNARTMDNLSLVREPLLIVHYAGDAATRLSEVHAMLDRSGASDKELHIVPGVEHYGFALPAKKVRTTGGTDKVVAWMRERFVP